MFRSLKKIAPTWSLCPAAFLVLMGMLWMCPAVLEAQAPVETPDLPGEDCDNPGDEENDGLADCDDPECIGTQACPVVATITVDNTYAFGFGNMGGITQWHGCFDSTGVGTNNLNCCSSSFGCAAGDILNASCANLNVHNCNGPERFSLAGSLSGSYLYLITFGDNLNFQAAQAKFSDGVNSISTELLPGNIQWQVFATGIETTNSNTPFCDPSNPIDETDVNLWITLANDYTDNGVQIPNTASQGGAASPGWVDSNGPIYTTVADAGYKPTVAFEGAVATYDYPFTAATSGPAGSTCTHFDDGDPITTNDGNQWMWYNPDQNGDGIGDSANPFDNTASSVGDYLIFRIGPLDELLTGCHTENEIIECGSDVPGDNYTVTFDVVNESGFAMTQLVIPGQVGGATISPNIINFNPAIANGATATGVQLSVNGGTAGDTLCIPIGLNAVDADGTLFPCCGTEVCVVLPDCCLKITDELFSMDLDGNLLYEFYVTNLDEMDPEIADHLFMSVISPPGAAFTDDWHALNGLGDSSSIGLATSITGAVPGDLICYQVTIHDASLSKCCGIIHYVDTLPFTSPDPQFLRGDANSDGSFDISDVVSGLDYLFQAQAVPCLVALDSNDDETVNIADSIFSLDALFGGGPSPWPPYQQCGIDETTGPLGCGSFPACEENGSGPQGG